MAYSDNAFTLNIKIFEITQSTNTPPNPRQNQSLPKGELFGQLMCSFDGFWMKPLKMLESINGL